MEYKFEKVLSMLNKGGIDINSLVEHNNKHVSGEIFSGSKPQFYIVLLSTIIIK